LKVFQVMGVPHFITRLIVGFSMIQHPAIGDPPFMETFLTILHHS